MNQLQERIQQFRKMASDDPDNELGHFRLGQLLVEAGQLDEAVQAFRRTLDLNAKFSKVYQLLGSALIRLNRQGEAIEVLEKGFAIAREEGDYLPRDEMAKLLSDLGRPVVQALEAEKTVGDGFRCRRPGCTMGNRARRLPAPPFQDETGTKIQATVCADCWEFWLRNYSIKVINELRLDLSTERGQEEYDRYMGEFLGLE